MTFKSIPIERKQSIQVSIFEKLAICFVAFLVPASALAGLIVMQSALLDRNCLDGHSLYYSTRKASTWHISLKTPPAYRTRDIFLYHSFLSRIFGHDRSMLANRLVTMEIPIGTCCIRKGSTIILMGIVIIP